MPQMSPMNWMTLSMMCYLMMNMIKLTTESKKSKKMLNNNNNKMMTMKKWTW